MHDPDDPVGTSRDPSPGAPFRHGVASGDPLPRSVILWTRWSGGGPAELEWRIARDPEFADVVSAGTVRAGRHRDYTAKVEADGLSPGTDYWYRFEADGARSPAGRTRTAPARDGSPEPLRLAFTSCAKWTAGHYNVYGRLAERDDLDLVLHVGDYIYEYGNDPEYSLGAEIGRTYDPDHECVTLADYRTRYAQSRLDRQCRAMHRAHPTVHIFDDHELANDAWEEGAGAHDPDSQGPWRQRRQAALRAWREWLPVRVPSAEPDGRYHRRIPLGDLAELFVVDCRTRRDRQSEGAGRLDPARQMLGEEQEAWLMEGLRESSARWKLVANPVMIAPVVSDLLPEYLADPLSELGVLTDQKEGPGLDQWEGYPAARHRLFQALRSGNVENLLFLSGDVHTGWASHLAEAPAMAALNPVAVELVTSSVTSENLDEEVGVDSRLSGPDVEEHIRGRNPHVEWTELDDHGYVVVDIDRDRARAGWWAVETVVEPDEGERRTNVLEVPDGEARLVAPGESPSYAGPPGGIDRGG